MLLVELELEVVELSEELDDDDVLLLVLEDELELLVDEELSEDELLDSEEELLSLEALPTDQLEAELALDLVDVEL